MCGADSCGGMTWLYGAGKYVMRIGKEQNRLMEEYEKNGLEAYRAELRKAAERLVADHSL